MKELSPRKVLKEIADAAPPKHRKNIVVIGSVAAAYHFFGQHKGYVVRTKDADCVLSPRAEAVAIGQSLARQLLDAGWTHRTKGGFGKPQESPTPNQTLSAIRLHPPTSRDWFLELLTLPKSENDRDKNWVPVHLAEGYFALSSFGFLSIAVYRPLNTEFGIRYARPEMMGLANLLSHPVVGRETMSTLVEGRAIKRSNKDLGRVLALARLSGDATVQGWAGLWREALTVCFPTHWRGLLPSTGTGLHEMLGNDDHLGEAVHTCNAGLLARQPVTLAQLRATGHRLLQDAVEPLESFVKA